MEWRSLGSSDLRISRVGVGTAPMGSRPGAWRLNWGPQDEGDSIRAIHTALDGGVNWIDTAPFYGWGRAEEVVGRAVADRDDVLVFTKCGTSQGSDGQEFEDLSPPAIRRGVEVSLRRLRRERVDLLQFHDPDPSVPIEESWGVLHELVAEGKVRYGGLSNHPVDAVERALTVGPVAALQFQYSALVPDAQETLLPFAAHHGIGTLVWSPLASGFLTDGFTTANLTEDDFRRTLRFASLDLADLHEQLRRRGGGSVTRGALAFVLANPSVTGAIVGIRNEREAVELAAMASSGPKHL